MARPPKSPAGPTRQLSINFDPEALAPGLRFHDLRHTCASHLIAIGAHPKYIQAQLGHSTIAVTFDVYGHLFKNERFMDRLDHTPDHSSSPTTQRRAEGI